MPTKPKTDADSLRKRLLAVVAKEVRAAEKWKKDHPDELLDYKVGNMLTNYLKQLTEVMNEEERWARKMLNEASKLNVAELIKRAGEMGGGEHEAAPETDEDE